MMKIKRFNEVSGVEIKELLSQSLIYISDIYGEPSIYGVDYGELKSWVVSWTIKGGNLSDFNEVNEVSKKITNLSEIVDDLLTTADRFPDYKCYVSVGTELKIKFVPKKDSSALYKFIKGQDWRCITINISDIERFFERNSITLSKVWEVENGDNVNVYVKFNKSITDVFGEFNDLFETEYNTKIDDGTIDRNIDVRCEDRQTLIFYTNDDKTYIDY